MTTLKQNAKAAQQITFDTSTGNSTYLPFDAPLGFNPAIVIFDNQSTVAVTVSDDGSTDFKTFAIGQGLSVDLRANRGEPADELTWPINTQFYANCAAGTGSFLISYIYAK